MADSPSFDFSGLSAAEQWLILYEGWRIGQKYPDGRPWVQPSPRQVKRLIERGLMQCVERVDEGHRFPLVVKEYHVPIAVHFAFCMSCDGRGDEDMGAA